ncbi:MAG: hypothetical protein M0030_07895 [Actinomycetota bacterium]|nr:hypothetical protein [Actinomycetota bacterium]
MRRGTVVRLLAAAVAARAGYAALGARPPGGADRWTRTNHRGEPVTLLEGPAVALAGAAAALVTPGLSRRDRASLAVAAAGSGAFGGYDDLAGGSDQRGFRGHLGALADGQVTTGAVKLAGIGVTGVIAAALRDAGPASPSRRAADLAINSTLIASAANLMNLFDLRPGRAIKVTMLAGAGLAAAGPDARAVLAAPAGAAIAMLPEDLAERAMLGDCGANALGAMLGVAAASAPRRTRVAAITVILALTAASEKISFTKVIERTPPLHWLDMLGRRPVTGPASGSAGPDRLAGGHEPVGEPGLVSESGTAGEHEPVGGPGLVGEPGSASASGSAGE